MLVVGSLDALARGVKGEAGGRVRRPGAYGWPDLCGVVVVEASICLSDCKVWCMHTTHSEVEVVGGQVFRAPGWSAGFLHLHFSVARSVPVGWRRRVNNEA